MPWPCSTVPPVSPFRWPPCHLPPVTPLLTVCRMILTDAMALLYRSHFAFGEAHRLRNTAGTPPLLPLPPPPAQGSQHAACWLLPAPLVPKHGRAPGSASPGLHCHCLCLCLCRGCHCVLSVSLRPSTTAQRCQGRLGSPLQPRALLTGCCPPARLPACLILPTCLPVPLLALIVQGRTPP